MRRLLVPAALVLVALSVFAGSSSARTIRKCIPNYRPGLMVENKVTVIVYCGTARATLKAGSTKYVRSNGGCFRVVGSLTIGLGKFTSGLHTPLYPAALIVVPATRDGTYTLGVITLQSKGKTLAANKVRVVVSGKRSRGTFRGKFTTGASFSGSFTCK